MNKLLFILFIPLIVSCSKVADSESTNFKDIKYYTQQSKKSGSLINAALEEKDVFILAYPEYVSESYSLIKFISAIMAKESELTVLFPDFPLEAGDKPFIDTIRENSPLLGFNEFIDLYDFYKKLDVTITQNILTDSGRLLILSTADKFEAMEKVAIDTFGEEALVKIVVPGTKYTKDIDQVIKELPIIKKISSVPLIDNKFDIMMISGEIENYRPVTPIELYSIENYLKAPESFLVLNKSFVESIQIKKMNYYLGKLVSDSFNNIGD